MATIDTYLNRFGYAKRQLNAPVPSRLGISVVIPCINEPDLPGSLDALWQCDRPEADVEVIVVINHSTSAPLQVIRQNKATQQEVLAWQQHHVDPRWSLHVIRAPDLPSKHAGAGLARKIGMDEALRRFHDAGNLQGIIAAFDADCRCDPNYLCAIESHFRRHPDSPGCSIYLEHPLEGSLDPAVYDAIGAYELHLRYYTNALRWAGLPYGYQTIGSSMAVRASAYMKQGGMNRRKAGEDFYFLHKIIALGKFTELNATRVLPSPRASDRVPFGTGKAVGDILHGKPFRTYPPQAFEDIRQLVEALPSLSAQFNRPLHAFLEGQAATKAIEEIRANTATEASFRQRFFRWFDAFKAMKYIHHARDTAYGDADVNEAAAWLWQRLGGASTPSLLTAYRQHDRDRCT